jgi:hypothetical protein
MVARSNRVIRFRGNRLNFMHSLDRYKFGGRLITSTNILLLISEMEGTYQNLKYMGFEEDMNTIGEMKRRYYKLYYQKKKEENDSQHLS